MRLTTAQRGYGGRYQAVRRSILGPAGKGDLPVDPPCHWRHRNCTGIATTADHDPPMEVTGAPHLNLVPSCGPCNYGRRPGKVPTPQSAPPSRAW